MVAMLCDMRKTIESKNDIIMEESNMKKTKKTFAVIISSLLLTAAFTGCGSTDNSSVISDAKTLSNDKNDNSSSGNDVKTIKVGTGNNYNPACYLDENGEIAGYDPAVLKEIDELLPQYEFTYETFDFQNVVLALESGKIDLAAHQYEWNQQREDNYLFGEEGYTVFDEYVWQIGTDDTVYNSIEDLAGKTVQGSAGSNLAFFLENWNKANPDKAISIDYTVPATTEETVSYYLTGKWSAFIVPKKDIELYNAAYEGCNFKLAFDEPLYSSNTYFLYRKNDDEAKKLKEDVDGALKQLKDSGRLAEISTEYWGGDYTVSNAAYDFHKE